LLPLLDAVGARVVAYSRRSHQAGADRIEYRRLDEAREEVFSGDVEEWVCLAPIWVLPGYLPMIERCRPKRIVALSSTSIFTKQDSSDLAERETVARLEEGERQLIAWAESHDVEWVILRPTLIYGRGLDRNICEIARFIRRSGFFPLFGKALGLRQPVHVDDVAAACYSALRSRQARNHAYSLSGETQLTYRGMVGQVFGVLGRRKRFVQIPMPMFRAALACLRLLPRFRKWSPAMAERMNRDMVFDHFDASRDLGFSPRPFLLDEGDMPATPLDVAQPICR
jgi:nucleoside-diphosphate-sugar epimerase